MRASILFHLSSLPPERFRVATLTVEWLRVTIAIDSLDLSRIFQPQPSPSRRLYRIQRGDFGRPAEAGSDSALALRRHDSVSRPSFSLSCSPPRICALSSAAVCYSALLVRPHSRLRERKTFRDLRSRVRGRERELQRFSDESCALWFFTLHWNLDRYRDFPFVDEHVTGSSG